MESVLAQTYQNVRILVSVHDKRTEAYVKKYPVEIVKVKEIRKKDKGHTPWNKYMNDLLARVKRGYVVYLDDDAAFVHDRALEIINEHLTDKLLIWKYRFASGRTVPESQYWGKRPERQHIDTGCFAHPAEYKPRWVTLRASDWRVARDLYDKIGAVFLDEVLIEAANNGDNGKRHDIILPK